MFRLLAATKLQKFLNESPCFEALKKIFALAEDKNQRTHGDKYAKEYAFARKHTLLRDDIPLQTMDRFEGNDVHKDNVLFSHTHMHARDGRFPVSGFPLPRPF